MFGPERLADVETFKRLGTEEHDLEESQQAIDLTGKNVGNCKPHRMRTVVRQPGEDVGEPRQGLGLVPIRRVPYLDLVSQPARWASGTAYDASAARERPQTLEFAGFHAPGSG